jgi:hypothetical protein
MSVPLLPNCLLAVSAFIDYFLTFKYIIMRKISMVAITLLALASCTDNQRARSFGGTETIKI